MSEQKPTKDQHGHAPSETGDCSRSRAAPGSMRCEGWRRSGGAFSLGPLEWHQCENDGTVMLKLDQGGEISELPACQHCWNECLETTGIEVLEAKPFSSNDREETPTNE